jgi:hypothetical protein
MESDVGLGQRYVYVVHAQTVAIEQASRAVGYGMLEPDQISRFDTDNAFFSMNSRRGST